MQKTPNTFQLCLNGRWPLTLLLCPIFQLSLAREVALGPWNQFSIPLGLLLHWAAFPISTLNTAAFPISAFDLAGFSFQVSSLSIGLSWFQRFSFPNFCF